LLEKFPADLQRIPPGVQPFKQLFSGVGIQDKMAIFPFCKKNDSTK
jgi:hypothetical protein